MADGERLKLFYIGSRHSEERGCERTLTVNLYDVMSFHNPEDVEVWLNLELAHAGFDLKRPIQRENDPSGLRVLFSQAAATPLDIPSPLA